MTHTHLPPQVYRLQEVDSTLDALKRHVSSTPDTAALTTFIADQQTRGRGRSGRQWNTLPGQSLLMATLVTLRSEYLGWVTALAGMATLEALHPHAEGLCLKWPNDILHGGRKIAGILCEHMDSDDGVHRVAVGIGVNLGDIPAEAGDRASSLPLSVTSDALPSARDDIRESILAGILANMRTFMDEAAASTPGVTIARWREHYERSLGHLGATTTVRLPDASTIVGRAVGISADAALVLVTPDGHQRVIHVGDVDLPDNPSHYPSCPELEGQ